MFSRGDLCFQEVISVLKTDLIACVRDLKSCRTPRLVDKSFTLGIVYTCSYKRLLTNRLHVKAAELELANS